MSTTESLISISLETSNLAETVRDWSEEEFLNSLALTASAPKSLRSAAEKGNVAAFGKAVAKQMASGEASLRKFARKHEMEPASICATEEVGNAQPVTELLGVWSEAVAKPGNRSRKIRTRLGDALSDWLGHVAESEIASAHEWLLAAEVLAFGCDLLEPRAVFALWQMLLVECESLSNAAAVPENLLADRHLESGAELPWCAGLLFRHFQGAETLAERGRGRFHTLIDEHTDTDGTPHAELLPRLPWWTASLARAVQWGKMCGESLFETGDAQSRFRGLIDRAASLCGHKGRGSMSDESAPACGDTLAWGGLLVGMKAATVPLLSLRPKSGGGEKSAIDWDAAEPPSHQSDWAHLAVLRSSWAPKSDRITVTHEAAMPRVHLAAHGESFLAGDWDCRLEVNGETLSAPDGWRCVCWHSDDDVDFIELQAAWDDETRIERQILLSRTDRFAAFVDCVRGPQDAALALTSRWPLADGLNTEEDTGTRELRVAAKKRAARVFPLGLPAEHVTGTEGALLITAKEHNSRLELRQTGTGGIYAPVVFEWKRTRKNSYADWRTLTVTEDGRRLGPREAAACRLRVGNSQWFFYRSMNANGELRAALGHHTGHETVIGRINKKGAVEPLLLVHANDD